MTKTAHTPKPWKIGNVTGWNVEYEDDDGYGSSTLNYIGIKKGDTVIAIVVEADGSVSNDELKANAAYIIKSVNCHAELVEALKLAERAANYVVQICEADLADGESASPHRKSSPHAVMAHCYAAMNFVGKARKALAKAGAA